MGKRQLAFGLTVILAAALFAGCASKPAIQYSKSDRQPVLVFYKSQALPPEFAPAGPTLIAYGTGTAYQQKSRYHYMGGKLSERELNDMLSSVVEAGFFDLKTDQGRGAPGGVTDHVTVALTGRSKSVEGPDNAGGALGEIVKMLESYKIPGATPYAPPMITLHAAEYTGSQPWTGKIVAWTSDPAVLAKAASTGVASVSGATASKIWKQLGDSYDPKGNVAFSAGGKLYEQVYAIPVFPLPGV